MATRSTSRRQSVSVRPGTEADSYIPTQNLNSIPPELSYSGYDHSTDQHHIPPREPEIQARQKSHRQSHGSPPPRHADGGKQSFSERARQLPASRGLELLDHASPSPSIDENIQPYPKSRSQSTHSHHSPVDANSTPNSKKSQTSSPATRSDSRRVSGKSNRPLREWAPAKSPLKKLEITLDDISKEEKRARVEEAEMLLREARAGRQSRQIGRDTRSGGRKKEHQTQPETLEEAGLVRSLSGKQKGRLQESAIIESKRPESNRTHSGERESFDYEEQPRFEDNVDSLPEPEERVHVRRDPRANQPRQPPAQDTSLRNHGYIDNRIENNAPVQRSNSRKLQKRIPPDVQRRLTSSEREVLDLQRQNEMAGASGASNSPPRHHQPPLSRGAAEMEQMESGMAGIHGDSRPHNPNQIRGPNGTNQTHKKRASVTFAVPPPTPPPISEWKNADTGRLRVADFDLRDVDLDRPWWEGGASGNQRRRHSHRVAREGSRRKVQVKKNVPFNPPLHLQCGPLLRFTGLKREAVDRPNGPYEREIWRGSIMIVTKDSASVYDTPPTLRLFSQPMELIPPPPSELDVDIGGQLAPEYVDPIAGLTKMGKNGKLLYVKPVDHIEEGKSLCFIDNEDGLFEESPSPIDYSASPHVSKPPDARLRDRDGEAVGKYKEVKGVRLYADQGRDVTFWRFNLEIELGNKQERVSYRINEGSSVGFWIPAKGQSMNIMYHTGNGFGTSVDADKFSGPDPLWRDALNTHQTRPFHVMIGGGSQIYNDNIAFEAPYFQFWLDLKVKYEKYEYPLNLDIKGEIESFYLNNYSRWFSQGLFSMAASQIPMVNMWNDHDIIGGFGSFSDEFMRTPVFSGLGNIAFKYYMLFQHQSVPEETQEDEPSWILGASPGPYINHKSRNIFINLGRKVAFLAIDCRTERTRFDIMTDDTYDAIWEHCHRQIAKGEVKHLIVLSSVPVAYPRLALVENILNNRVIRGSRFGNFGFDNGTLDDQWTAKQHKLERRWLVEDLQELAAAKSVRVTMLSGDSNLAAIGQFYSNPKLQISKDKDYRYMPNVISSAIVDAPASEFLSDALIKRNKLHTLDTKTVEDMRPIFASDVDGKSRSNKRLLPRRNWCSIREYDPGTTPVNTPPELTRPEPQHSPEPRPRGGLMRSLSLTRGDGRPAKLMRRLSSRGGPPPTSYPGGPDPERRRMSFDDHSARFNDGYFATQQQNKVTNRSQPEIEHDDPTNNNNDNNAPRPGNFMRRRTDLSVRDMKRASKTGSGLHHFLNLEGGLDIAIHCEISPKDPAGITHPYRVLVPALFFDGDFEPGAPREKNRWWNFRKKRNSHGPQVQVSVGNMPNDEGNDHHSQQQQQLQQQQHPQQHPHQHQHQHQDSHHQHQQQYEIEDIYDDDDTPPHNRVLDHRPLTPASHDDDQYDDQGEQPSPPDQKRGYNGVEAYRRRKKWFGII